MTRLANLTMATALAACAVDVPTAETAEDLQTDWCDPYYQPSCGVVQIFDGGIASIGASMFNAIAESNGTVSLSASDTSACTAEIDC